MIHKKSTFFLGLFVLLIPFLGVPTSWKTTLIILSGLVLMANSVTITLPKKIIRPKLKKEKVYEPQVVSSREPFQYDPIIRDETIVQEAQAPSPKVDSISRPRKRKPKTEGGLPAQSGNKAE